jgi:5'-nucleotidase
MTFNGSQIDDLLEQQFDNPSPGSNRILQVSRGFSYSWKKSAPAGEKVNISGIRINGSPIDPSGLYRVTVNSFLADGGDNFTILKAGTDRVGGVLDIEAFVSYFEDSSPVAPGPKDRIALIK